MIEGEAKDLIHRIEHLEHNQLRAQAVKVRNRLDKIRVIGSDRLYTRSPEDIVIDELDKQEIRDAEERVLKRISNKSKEIYLLRDDGLYHKDIASILNAERSTITKNLLSTKAKLRKEFEVIKNGGDNYLFK